MTKAFCDITTALENRLKLTETANINLWVAIRSRDAESLRLELYKRRLPYTAIDWSADQQTDTPSKSDVLCDRNPVTEAPEAETEEKRTEPIEATESDVRDPPIDPADEVDPIELPDQAVDRVDQIDPAEQAVEPVDPVEQLKRRIKAFMNRSD